MGSLPAVTARSIGVPPSRVNAYREMCCGRKLVAWPNVRLQLSRVWYGSPYITSMLMLSNPASCAVRYAEIASVAE